MNRFQQPYPAIEVVFGDRIDLNNLANYANQPRPGYINKDNTGGNSITDAKATLGRVLFYDKNLSVDNTISCASCHKQEFAFSDTALVSSGLQGGITGRHSMRLVNTRFAVERNFSGTSVLQVWRSKLHSPYRIMQKWVSAGKTEGRD